MNTLLISCAINEGAGAVAREYADAFESIGDKCTILTSWPGSDDKRVVTLYRHSPQSFFSTAIRALKFIAARRIRRPTTEPNYHFRGFYETVSLFSTKTILSRIGTKPDRIIVLFNTNLVSFKNLHELATIYKIPVAIQMMDMRDITGGCCYAWDCTGYTTGCNNCPALKTGNKRLAAQNITYRHRYTRTGNIRLIASTDWQFRQARNSLLWADQKPVKNLLGMSIELFSAKPALEMRSKLGLPLEARIILVGAMSLAEKRKGFSILLEALGILKTQKSENVHIAILGNPGEKEAVTIPLPHTFLGYLPYERIAEAYCAADIFVCPSIEDSGPTMINQAMLCGTPVVSFNMGVAPDLVETGVTGYRAKLGSAEDLAHGIQQVLALDQNEFEAMKMRCRGVGVEKCDAVKQVRKLKLILE